MGIDLFGIVHDENRNEIVNLGSPKKIKEEIKKVCENIVGIIGKSSPLIISAEDSLKLTSLVAQNFNIPNRRINVYQKLNYTGPRFVTRKLLRFLKEKYDFYKKDSDCLILVAKRYMVGIFIEYIRDIDYAYDSSNIKVPKDKIAVYLNTEGRVCDFI